MMMIPILTRLLETRIVASNLSGRSSSFAITLLVFESELRMDSISEGVNEKKAASEPEINADTTSNMKITNKAIPRFRVNGFAAKSKAEIKTW